MIKVALIKIYEQVKAIDNRVEIECETGDADTQQRRGSCWLKSKPCTNRERVEE
jgi:hypothetical protein